MLKKYLFVLMALLLAIVAYADEMERTPTPEISCEYVGTDCYIYVSGEGVLTVYINGVEIPNFTSPYIIEAKIEEDQYFDIWAIAQLEGYLESEPAFYDGVVPGIYHTPTPMIYCDYDGHDGYLYVSGEGELTVAINGEVIPGFTSPYILEGKNGVDQYYDIVATARLEGYLESEPAYYTACVPAIWEPTPPPEISCEFVDNNCYVYVNGEGELTVSINGVEIPDFTSPYILEAKLGEDQQFEIMATAKLEGYLESEPAYYWVYLNGIWIPAPMPTMNVTTTDENVIVTFESEGDIFIIMEDNTFYYDGPIVFPRGEYDYDYVIYAIAEIPGYLPSTEGSYTIHVPALPVAETPEVTYVVEDNQLTVTYTNHEPNGVLYYRYSGMMYPSGDNMGWTEWMVYTGPIVLTQPGYYIFESYVEAPGKIRSWTYCIEVELPMPEEPVIPDEKTEAPTITEGGQSMSQWHEVGFITITSNEEDCVIYWRSRVDLDGESQGEWSDWYSNTDSVWIGFVDNGHYYFEAYAIAPGKLASDTIAYDLGFSQPPTPWDFMEDDIFYKITGPGTVGVTVCSDYTIFYNCDIVIPNTVTHNGVTYTVTSIEDGAFYDCYILGDVTIGDSVTTIGDYAFEGCFLMERVTMGDNVISVGELAFFGCSNLASVTIGSGVRTIGSKAFDGCTALDTIICKAIVPPVMADSVCFPTEAYNNALLLVPRTSMADYAAADYWYKFAHIEGWGSVGSGDLNGDGHLDVDDLKAIIDILISGMPAPIEADCNHDGRVDVDDVTALINMLLNGTLN